MGCMRLRKAAEAVVGEGEVGAHLLTPSTRNNLVALVLAEVEPLVEVEAEDKKVSERKGFCS